MRLAQHILAAVLLLHCAPSSPDFDEESGNAAGGGSGGHSGAGTGGAGAQAGSGQVFGGYAGGGGKPSGGSGGIGGSAGGGNKGGSAGTGGAGGAGAGGSSGAAGAKAGSGGSAASGGGVVPKVTQITAGRENTCAVLADRSVKCWGSNVAGQLGIGTSDTNLHSLPTAVQLLADAKVVRSAGYRTMAVTLTGDAYWWGTSTGESTGNSFVPVKLASPTSVTDVATRFSPAYQALAESCAVLSDKSAVCWTPTSPNPTAVASPGGNVEEIAYGLEHACARQSSGNVYCWGKNDSGQLGIGASDSAPHSTPVKVVGLAPVKRITAGGSTTCAIAASDGSLFCWGGNQTGVAGAATTATTLPTPASLPGTTDAIDVGVGGNTACAAFASGEVRCWGSNTSGQLGTGQADSTFHPMPSTVAKLQGIVQVAVGSLHACALEGSGTVWCWGENGLGQLGDGTNQDKPSPVQAVGL